MKHQPQPDFTKPHCPLLVHADVLVLTRLNSEPDTPTHRTCLVLPHEQRSSCGLWLGPCIFEIFSAFCPAPCSSSCPYLPTCISELLLTTPSQIQVIYTNTHLHPSISGRVRNLMQGTVQSGSLKRPLEQGLCCCIHLRAVGGGCSSDWLFPLIKHSYRVRAQDECLRLP